MIQRLLQESENIENELSQTNICIGSGHFTDLPKVTSSKRSCAISENSSSNDIDQSLDVPLSFYSSIKFNQTNNSLPAMENTKTNSNFKITGESKNKVTSILKNVYMLD